MTGLPPITALRAFEAAGRHLSMMRAAEELAVTHGAVSRQIRRLEEHFARRLFRRTRRGLEFTEDGRLLFGYVADAFARLWEGNERLAGRAASGRIVVSTTPAFAARWLLPRLSRFRRANPDLEVVIDAAYHLVELRREGGIVAIRYGLGDWPRVRSERILTLRVFPVCAPGRPGAPSPARLDDLRHAVLLHDTSAELWAAWLERAGATGVDPERGEIFNDYGLVIRAAAEGLGVALGRGALIADELRAGTLVKPFELEIESDRHYYLVRPDGTAESDAIARFRAWLLAEAAADDGS